MKLLIAGFGSIGRRHFRNLIALHEKEIILFRSYQSTLDDQEIEGYIIERDLSAALEHQPDGVIVANPTALHLDVAIPAARQGCHILLEKPISHSMDRINLLRKAAQESGSRILIAFQFRFHPGLLKIKEWIKSGEIGDVYYARAHWGEYLPDWHPWEDFRKGYSARKDLGGGVLLTLCHPIDYLGWLFGPVDKVSGTCGPRNVLGIDVEELIDITLQFRDGLLGGLHLNYLQRPAQHSLEIFGSEGAITWTNSGDLRLYQIKNGSWESYPLPKGFSRNDLFREEIKHFLEVISGDTPKCTLEEGIQTQKIIAAAYKAIESGQAAFV